MKTIQVNLYEFAELEARAKEKAIETDRYINVDYRWWDFIYDDFISICQTIGMTVKKESIVFEGFYSQGDGSAFKAEIDLPQLLEAVASQNWKSYAPKLELDLFLPELDRRILKLIRESKLDIDPQVIQPTRSYYVRAELNENLPYSFHGYPQIEKELDLLEKWLQQIADKLNRHLYKSLEDEYEYQTDEQAVTEAIEANDYWFTADGKKATRLESLSFKNSMETL
ncbi:hypothetical protein [Mucilaginibacter sp. 10B2]|uniref:hypothetical protein n=1 Tax=Mucilaginibacter sp. 10B2 TaxID=3048574 RepID=UPI002B233F5C|nr:hypothetical protein [Mucilaginibacter sp. 10B2]MEB0280855.1 hypothetical protein [Mucilaginibacter sp. 10B2]